jgi:alpha-D-ribose 1-methylphosphonate 5-triphosphate synthase subunit PhnG
VIKPSRNYRRSARDESDSGSSTVEGSDRQEARLAAILAALQKSGSVSVEELSNGLQVSHVTVRRDLARLLTPTGPATHPDPDRAP